MVKKASKAGASRRAAAKGGKRAAKRAAPAKRAARKPGPGEKPAHIPFAESTVAAGVGASPQAQTVIYIHGIANKPVASVLKCQWDKALFGVDLGDRSRMAYWVNRQYYPEPEAATCGDGDRVAMADDQMSTAAVMALAASVDGEAAEHAALGREIDALAKSAKQKTQLLRIAAKMAAAEAAAGAAGMAAAGTVGTKVLPLPGFLRRLVVLQLTRAFLRDVNDFLFKPDRRKAMTDSLRERIAPGGGPFVIVAHSQGSMIAYDVLRQLTKEECDVRLLVTVGSPLGLQEVQDAFAEWTGSATLKPPACVARWVNVADRLDPVALDTDISNDFKGAPKIENHDRIGINPDGPRHPHSATGYLITSEVRNAVRDTVSSAFAQAVGRFVISRDLVEELEDAMPQEVRRTLIQLNTPDWAAGGSAEAQTMDAVGRKVLAHVERMARETRIDTRRPPERLKRFVVADLTRQEVESLRTVHADLEIARIWTNAVKRTMIFKSTHAVQARPANLGYGATGRDIGWAVLDTGIRGDHPHFARYQNLGPQWNCTLAGAPIRHEAQTAGWKTLDGHGHGTHVAATIAGALRVPERAPRGGEDPAAVPRLDFSGMAPEAKIYGFKVLEDDGRGHDSYIIKALDTIADLNDQAGWLMIHGVNLSLGGNFDPRVYGCGHTPLCQELRRLWRQGVVVCLAAGNEGWALVQEEGGFMPTNRDISIGDPANLDEAIAVGSVHRDNPHTYGISYFSSRGPTADGRQKPDLVAPGERIVSAFHRWPSAQRVDSLIMRDLYVEMSGTSMSTPHVSGVIAAFLSIRREFIGFPDRVKAMLLKACTSLGRDPYMQGAGMPNLIRMLTES